MALSGAMDRQLSGDPTLRGVLSSSVRYSVFLLFAVAALMLWLLVLRLPRAEVRDE